MTSMPARMAAIALRRVSTLADPGCLADVHAERPEPGPHDLLHLVGGRIAGHVPQTLGFAEAAALVDAGVLRSTASRVQHPLDAARLIEARRLVEHGGIAGKVVVARSMDDMAQPAREDGR